MKSFVSTLGRILATLSIPNELDRITSKPAWNYLKAGGLSHLATPDNAEVKHQVSSFMSNIQNYPETIFFST